MKAGIMGDDCFRLRAGTSVGGRIGSSCEGMLSMGEESGVCMARDTTREGLSVAARQWWSANVGACIEARVEAMALSLQLESGAVPRTIPFAAMLGG